VLPDPSVVNADEGVRNDLLDEVLPDGPLVSVAIEHIVERRRLECLSIVDRRSPIG